MSNEFIYIVLDIGSRYIRAGFAGDELPKVTLVNKGYNNHTSHHHYHYHPPFLQLDDHTLTATQYNDIIAKLDKSMNQLINIYRQDSGNWLDFRMDLKSYNIIIHQHLLELFNCLPIDLTRVRLMVLDDNGKFSLIEKYHLAQILLLKIGVKSLQFIPSNIVSVISSKELNGNGFLIELNWSSFKISAVMDFRVIDLFEDFTKLTGINLHYKLMEELIKINHPVIEDKNRFDIVQRFILNHSYGGSTVDSQSPIELDVDGYKFPGRLRNEVINSMILDIIDHISNMLSTDNTRLGPDAIRILRQNILFEGGISNIPGVKTKILQMLRQRLSVPIKANKCLGSWQGASIYCSTSILKRSRSIRKSEELTKEIITDVTSERGIQLTRIPDLLNYSKPFV